MSKAQAVRRGATAASFLLPSAAILLPLRVAPIAIAIYLSLTRWDGLGDPQYVALDNYRRALSDDDFHQTLQNNLKILISIPVWLALAFGLSALIYERIKFAGLLRFTLFIPVVMSPAILGLYFSLSLGLDGPFNRAFDKLQLSGLKHEWLVDPDTAFWVFLAILIWTALAVNSLFYSAALGTLDTELLDAAAIDGAGLRQRYRHVIVPHVRYTTILLMTFNVIIAMTSTFPLLYTLTGGGPGHETTTADLSVYQVAFVGNDFGYSAALAVIVLALVFALLGLVGLVRRWVPR